MNTRIIAVIVALQIIASAALAQSVEEENPLLKREENEAFQQAREAWKESMHRAEPGLNWRAIDNETRELKAAQYYALRYHKQFSTLSVSDTFARGAIFGTWSERGSNNVCGRTHTADIDFETNTIYVASAMGNIWKAKVGDSNWMVLNDAHRFGDVRTLRILHISANKKRLLAACNGSVAVRYSDDDGLTWKEASGLDGPKSWGSIKRAVVAADEKTIYLVGNEWDYSSNWRAVSFLYRSTDQGATFTKIGNWNASVGTCDVWVSRDKISPAYFLKEDTLFSVAANGSLTFVAHRPISADGLYLDGKVTENGTTLAVCEVSGGSSTVSVSSGSMNLWTTKGSLQGSPFSANSFRIAQSNDLAFYIGTNEVNRWIGGDFSVTFRWSDYYADPLNNLHADIDGIDILHDLAGTEVTLVSTDGGTYRSDDEVETATNLTFTGIRTSQYYSTYTSVAPEVINAGSQDQGFQRTTPASNNGILDMDQIISGDYGHLVSGDSGTSLWGDYPGFVIYYPNARTSIASRSWDFIGNNALWLPPVVASPIDGKIAYVCAGDSASAASNLWKLDANGQKITAVRMPYDFSLGSNNRKISAMAFSAFDTNELYALSNDGYFYRSTDGGADWTHSDTNSLPASHYFYGSTILPSHFDKNKLWIAGSGYSNPGVLVSLDHGKTFTAIDSGLPKTLVYGLCSSEDERFLFAATEVGPYIFDSRTGIWYDLQAAAGITAPDMLNWSVERVPHSNTIRFGTHGRGIWDFSFDTVGAPSNGVTEHYTTSSLSLVAIPSVTNNETTLQCSLPEAAEVRIRIVDLMGKTVRSMSGHFEAGQFRWVWDGRSQQGSSVPSGYYTVLLSTAEATAFTKVSVVR